MAKYRRYRDILWITFDAKYIGQEFMQKNAAISDEYTAQKRKKRSQNTLKSRRSF